MTPETKYCIEKLEELFHSTTEGEHLYNSNEYNKGYDDGFWNGKREGIYDCIQLLRSNKEHNS